MTPEDKRIMFRVATWVCSGKRIVVETIRQLAETEENYRVIIREIDRVKLQCSRAHTLGAEATLTLEEWLVTLEDFDWKCAYCQLVPFQIMSHVIALPGGGTVLENCVPACYKCSTSKYKKNEYVQKRVRAYLASRTCRDEHASTVESALLHQPLS